MKDWGAKVVYGDTDSLFIYLPGKSKDEAFRIGDEIAERVTSLNPRPIKLKFEKVSPLEKVKWFARLTRAVYAGLPPKCSPRQEAIRRLQVRVQGAEGTRFRRQGDRDRPPGRNRCHPKDARDVSQVSSSAPYAVSLTFPDSIFIALQNPVPHVGPLARQELLPATVEEAYCR